MNKYAIIVDMGYGFGMTAETKAFIHAKTAIEARKIFLEKHKGAWYANPKMIKATKVVA